MHEEVYEEVDRGYGRLSMGAMTQKVGLTKNSHCAGHRRQIHLRQEVRRRELNDDPRLAVPALNGQLGLQYVRLSSVFPQPSPRLLSSSLLHHTVSRKPSIPLSRPFICAHPGIM